MSIGELQFVRGSFEDVRSIKSFGTSSVLIVRLVDFLEII